MDGSREREREEGRDEWLERWGKGSRIDRQIDEWTQIYMYRTDKRMDGWMDRAKID